MRAAKSTGQKLGRRLQTGYDADSGHPIYEEEELEFEGLPQIVVIVDELAEILDDLPDQKAIDAMSSFLQQISERGRVAGVHMMVASNRWAVEHLDHFTGARAAARISYRLPSLEESKAFLHAGGADSLSEAGDMLYMPSGMQIARVYGPFVSDEEVRAVADHWRAQGSPDYISVLTEEREDGAPADAALYRKAVEVVASSQKASTSYVQRQLRIGYNIAARLIERMEKDGKVGAPDHVGRREVLIDRDGASIEAPVQWPNPRWAPQRKRWWQR